MAGQIQLKEIDKLILQDIKEHPGTSQAQVAARLAVRYRSKEYIRTNINRLIVLGFIRDERAGQAARLTCIS